MPSETKLKELPFAAIFPDTNLFLPNWPAEPSGLADLVSAAGAFNIPVYFLETVELELEAHWIRDVRTESDKLQAQMAKLPEPLRTACKLEVPRLSEAISLYRKMAEATEARLGMLRAGFRETGLRELYQMAIDQEHPFVAEGKNFQDAVIVASILEFSRQHDLFKVAFVSKNHRDFDPVKLKSWAARYGVELQYYRNLNTVYDALIPFLDHVLQAAWHKDNASAKHVLESARPSLEAYLVSQFVKSDDVEIELVGIEEVRVAWWDKVTQKLQRVPVQITVAARFKATNYMIERGITVDGWAIMGSQSYERFEFESAYISR